MADIVYFNRPRGPSPTAKSYVHCKTTARVSKKRPSSVMERQPRACVARLVEPTFRSNNVFTLMLPGSSLYSDPTSQAGSSKQVCTPALGSSDSLEINGEVESLYLPHVQQRATSFTGADNGLGASVSQEADSLDPQQPSQHPNSISALLREDDGANRRRSMPNDRGQLTRRHNNIHANSAVRQIRSSGDIPLLIESSRPDAATANDSDLSPHELASEPPHRIVWDGTVDQNPLSVDDYRRTYDFVDFLDEWHILSRETSCLPGSGESSSLCTKVWRPPDQVKADQLHVGACDMQGLPWPMGSRRREQAMLARTVLRSLSFDDNRTSQPPAEVRYGTKDDLRCLRFRSFVPRHRAQVGHYQLRNLMVARHRNEILYATGKKVLRTSLACPLAEHVVMDLAGPDRPGRDFRITCLATTPGSEHAADGVLCAGGFNGEYAIQSLDRPNESHVEGYVSQDPNGIVTHVHAFPDRRSGLSQAAFCSNDRHVRLMDLRTLRFTSAFPYANPINCAATSPDGRLRALVGDCSETSITSAECGDILFTLQRHVDHGFACTWSPDGRHVATGAQDGKVILWDARNWSRPFRELESVMSCARSLHFTQEGSLVVAEDDDVVRVHGGADFDRCQTLRFFGSIAGVALLDGGAEIAIANVDKTVGGLMTFERVSERAAHWDF